MSANEDADDAVRNFIGLCVAFGVAHSCIIVGIAYASSVFDLTLGSASTGLVYTVYTLTSLLAAAPFVDHVGPRNGMTLSIIGFLLYLICFVVGQAADGSNEYLEYTVVIIGSICGGLSSSIGWVSQGVYYARSALLYSQATGISLEAANELFAGRFTAIGRLWTLMNAFAQSCHIKLSFSLSLIFESMLSIILFNYPCIQRLLAELTDLIPWDLSIDVGFQCLIYATSAVLLQDTAMSNNDLFIFLTFLILAALVCSTTL